MLRDRNYIFRYNKNKRNATAFTLKDSE